MQKMYCLLLMEKNKRAYRDRLIFTVHSGSFVSFLLQSFS